VAALIRRGIGQGCELGKVSRHRAGDRPKVQFSPVVGLVLAPNPNVARLDPEFARRERLTGVLYADFTRRSSQASSGTSGRSRPRPVLEPAMYSPAELCPSL
jgi:hypothetical protein